MYKKMMLTQVAPFSEYMYNFLRLTHLGVYKIV